MHFKILIGIIFCVAFSTGQKGWCQPANSDYWQIVDGFMGDAVLQQHDYNNNGFVFITNAWGLVNNQFLMRNTIHFHHFSSTGNWIKTKTFNIDDHSMHQGTEILYSQSRKKVSRLQNGNVLVGGHGVLALDSKQKLSPSLLSLRHPKKEYKHDPDFSDIQNYNTQLHPQESSGTDNYSYLSFKSQASTRSQTVKNDDTLYVHPLIFTFDSSLQSLLRIDTLERVPFFGAITLIHEVAPDTLIIGFHKSDASLHQLMETDSLFNIRWSTEFGEIWAWIAEIYDFQITSEGNYLVSLEYLWEWYGAVNPLGIRKNVLYKFDGHNGQQLWKKEIWKNKGYNKLATMAPYQDDKILIAVDDCCQKAPPDGNFQQIIFHEHTGMHLQVRNNDGEILEEKNLAPFLWNFVKAFEGTSVTGFELEDPDNVYPWFIPRKIIRNPDNTYLITGNQYSGNKRYIGRGFLLKLDEDLNPLWTRIFEIDKKNYPYGANYVWLNDMIQTDERICIVGTFYCYGFGGNPSPYYPPNQNHPLLFRGGLIIPLDEHGCYQPGCHLTDNVPYYELEQAISLSPNPARDQVHIHAGHKALHDKDKVLFISDMQGRQMLSKRFSAPEVTVSTAAFPEGIYLVYVMSRGQVFRAEKLVVR